MKKRKAFAVVVCLMLGTTILAAGNEASAQSIEALPRDVEIELASSALPTSRLCNGVLSFSSEADHG